MAIWNKYPYKDYNDYNLDWIIKTTKELAAEWSEYNKNWEETYEYVINYFKNLDLTAEVRKIVDSYIVDGTIENIIKTQMVQLESQVDTLSARLSNIEAGTTPAGAEVTDIRIAYNGQTYATAGDATRGQAHDAIFGYGKYAALSVASLLGPKTETLNGVTCTHDGNGNISVTGTATANTLFYIAYQQPIAYYLPVLTDYVYTCDSPSTQVTGQCFALDSNMTATVIYSGNSTGYVWSPRPDYSYFSLRIVVASGFNGSTTVKLNLESLRESSYGDRLIKDELLDEIIANDPKANQAQRINKLLETVGGITYQMHDARIYYAGTRTGSSIFRILSESDIAPFVAGETFHISYNGNGVMYLQLIIDGETLLSGLQFDGEPVTIPSDFTSFNFRVLINADGTYNASAPLTIMRGDTGGDKEITISTAAELYNFMQAPERYTKINLLPITYDLYTGLYESVILDDSYRAITYMSDVEICGNGATITLNIPAEVALAHGTSTSNVSVINIAGNCNIHDLTVHTENARYSVHDESLGDAKNYNTEHIYTNCDFTNLVTGTGVPGPLNTIGIGCSRGQHYLFDKCNFHNNSRAPFLFHGRVYNPDSLDFVDCWFDKPTGDSLTLYQYTGNAVPFTVNLIDSIIGRVRVFLQSGGDNACQYDIRAINSYITYLGYDANLTNIPTPHRINTISGTIDTSYATF